MRKHTVSTILSATLLGGAFLLSGCEYGGTIDESMTTYNKSITVIEDTPVSYTPTGESDITIHLENYPTKGTIEIENTSLVYSPIQDYSGNDHFDVVTTRADGYQEKYSVDVVVAPVNDVPYFDGVAAASARVDQLYFFDPMIKDTDTPSAQLTKTISNKPTWASFDSASGTLYGTPVYEDKGTYSDIIITVSDGQKVATYGPFNIDVLGADPAENIAPVISGSPSTFIKVGYNYSFTPTAFDPDGNVDYLVFSVSNKPTWATFNPANGSLYGTPTTGDIGTSYPVTISATDGIATASLEPFTIDVIGEGNNTAPKIYGFPSTMVKEGELYSFTPIASDAEGDTLTFMVTNKPAWTTFNPATGALYGTPATEDIGFYSDVTISVTDGTSVSSLPSSYIEVYSANAENHEPVISGVPSTHVNAGQSYSFTPVASDADGDTLTFMVANKPAWATFSALTGTLSGTPSTADVGDYPEITIGVSDGVIVSSLPPFPLTVEGVEPGEQGNTAPFIAGTPTTTIEQGYAYSFVPSASDADGDALTFLISNKPSWATFDAGTGALTGTPTADDVGEYPDIIISVSDGTVTSSLPAFYINVYSSNASNDAPVIYGVPTNYVQVDEPYSFVPVASDDDGDPLTFTIANKPIWATFNTVNGKLSGTPTAGDIGEYPDIVISVSDGSIVTSLEPFFIEVQ